MANTPAKRKWKRSEYLLVGSPLLLLLLVFGWLKFRDRWLPRTLNVTNGELRSIAFSPNGHFLASATSNWTPPVRPLAEVQLWDVKSGQLMRTIASDNYVSSITFAPDSKTLMVVQSDEGPTVPRPPGYVNKIKLWDVQTGALLHTIIASQHRDRTNFSPDGTLIISSGAPVQVWDVQTGGLLRTFGAKNTEFLRASAISRDGKRIAFDKFSKNAKGKLIESGVQLWDLQSGKLLRVLPGQRIFSLGFSPDGRKIVSGEFGRVDTGKLWDTRSGKLLCTLPQSSRVGFSKDGKSLVGIAILWGQGKNPDLIGGAVSVFDGRTGVLRWKQQFNSRVGWVRFSHDSHSLAVGYQDTIEKHAGQITLWDVRTGHLLRTFTTGEGDPVLDFSPDDKTLASGTGKTIKFWNISDVR